MKFTGPLSSIKAKGSQNCIQRSSQNTCPSTDTRYSSYEILSGPRRVDRRILDELAITIALQHVLDVEPWASRFDGIGLIQEALTYQEHTFES